MPVYTARLRPPHASLASASQGRSYPVPGYEAQLRPVLQEHIACCLGRVDAHAVCTAIMYVSQCFACAWRHIAWCTVCNWARTICDDGTRLGGHLELHGT